ncbi:MAG: hypothetical protein IPJ69_01075 [Deltaproteobacteria bacterium]|nr:MAG: hypothetical protein IPJ69_01075 [Deltaproteobacteria bacterium]
MNGMDGLRLGTTEIVAFTILLIAVFGIPVYYRRWENKYLKKKTKEVLSDSLREEIEKERAESIRKKALFDEAMKNAQK